MEVQLCPSCGNNHQGGCTTQLIYLVWYPQQGRTVKQVEVVGSWHQWQKRQKLCQQRNQIGQVYFQLGLTLPVGVYQYKYLVDGQWTVDQTAQLTKNEYNSSNNVIQVYPKKTFVQIAPKNDIKITSNITVEGLRIIGSWDNWQQQIPMKKSFNHLKNCQQNVVYLRLVPNTSYQFKFKIGKQYLIDQKYPTIINEMGTQNNRIITYSQRIQTPTGWKSKQQSYTAMKNITGKTFEWQRVATDSQMSYERVQGHSLCTIGDHMFIFGGKTRGQFVNTLIKINVHQFSHNNVEEVVPNGRAFHSIASYGNKMIIYGGINNTILDDYNSFNTSECTWNTTPNLMGEYPVKKQKYTCVLFDMMLIFFGGYNCSADFQYETYYNQISVLDIEHMRWINGISTQGARPIGRFAHAATLIGSEMYIFGGLTNAIKQQENIPTKSGGISDQQSLNDLWKIDLDQVNKKLKWIEIKPKSKSPNSRYGHTMNVIAHLVIIFAGRNDKNQFMNDICVFDTVKTQWIFPIVHGQIPRPRYNHASTVVHNDYLVVFGGKTKDQKVNKYFYLLKPKEFQPSLNIEEEDSD